MSVAPHSGIIDFGTFTSPDGSVDGIQGEVPAPLAIEAGYFLSTAGWVPGGGGGGGVTSVTGTAPIASSGGTTPAISITQASGSTNGYLSSTDWNTFNGKQPAGSYLTTSDIGTTVQPYDADLTAWAAIAPSAKQDTLTSGTNIKTVNSTSLLGSGDLALFAGGLIQVKVVAALPGSPDANTLYIVTT